MAQTARELRLVAKAKAGDGEAWSQLFWPAAESWRGLVTSYVGGEHRQLADDAFSRAAVKAWVNLGRYTPMQGVTFRQWLRRVLLREAANVVNEQARWYGHVVSDHQCPGVTELMPDEAEPVDEQLARQDEAAEEAARVWSVLLSLDDRVRECVVLFAVGGFGYRETGELLGLPTGTVGNYIFQARGAVRAALAA